MRIYTKNEERKAIKEKSTEQIMGGFLNTDTELAIGVLVGTFGFALICMITILFRASCLEDHQEVAPSQVQEADDYILIVQESPQPQ